MSAENYLRTAKTERPRIEGFFRAKVEDNEDPYRLGRVRVRVFPLFNTPEIDADHLPWAQPCWWMPMQIPPVGSWVWVFFEQGDPLRPVYFGHALPLGEGDRLVTEPGVVGRQAGIQYLHPRTWTEETDSSYPSSYLIRTPQGNLVKIDDSTGEISIYNCHGAIIRLESNGDVLIYSASGSQLRLGENVTLHSAGDLSVKAAGKIYLCDPESPSKEKKWNE